MNSSREKFLHFLNVKAGALICAFLTVFVFAFRWRNCLPFSGNMPALKDGDNLAILGRYLIYAREPFGFPLGLVKGLGFPFDSTNISKASIPLFAILFKFLSKLYPPLVTFDFMVLFELVSVFLSAYFTCLILRSFGIRDFAVLFLGSVLVGLSPALLYRSSEYYNLSFAVGYFPVYLAAAFFYIRMYRAPSWRTIVPFSMMFPVAALVDYYLLLGMCVVFSVCLALNAVSWLLRSTEKVRDRAGFVFAAFMIGIILSCLTLRVLDDQGNLTAASKVTPFSGRYGTAWGYGGGYGGGFHVADVLTLFVPPIDEDHVPVYRRGGPSAYLTKLGFPLNTDKLQDGQYEGFTYMGTTAVLLLVFLLCAGIVRRIRGGRVYLNGLKVRMSSGFLLKGKDISLPVTLGISTFALYVISWGYIIHIGGVRFNNIITPSLVIAEMYPTFMFARSMGRLAVPFMLFVTIAVTVGFGYYLQSRKMRDRPFVSALGMVLVFVLIAGHVNEIKGYLRPSEVVRGNDIINVFGYCDRALIQEILQGKAAVMAVPAFRSSILWSKICYSLAFFSGVPVSGATASLGTQTPAQEMQYERDLSEISLGNISAITARYGDVAIAAPLKIAEEILKKTDQPLQMHKLNDQDVVLLTPDLSAR